MKVTTVQARDMREALQEVKEKLGADAVILSTRNIRSDQGANKGRSMIEVTACPSPASRGHGATPEAALSVAKKSTRRAEKKKSRFSAVADEPLSLASLEKASSTPEKRPEKKAPVRQKTAVRRRRVSGGSSSYDSELLEIRSTLAQMKEEMGVGMVSSGELANLDEEGKQRYSWLLMHGVEEPIARKIALVDRGETERGLEFAIKRFLKFRDPLQEPARVIALVGPTGVGKTTTLAKISADLILNRRKTVGMITLDTFRVGAVAQLETYARLLQVRLVVARSLSEVKAGLQSLNRCDYILVDTVGSSPYNRRQVNSTAGLLPVMGNEREVLLCMAGNVRETEQQAIYRRFSTLQPTGLIFTKLDETVTYGGILNVAVRARLPLTLYTDGQRVPENLGWLSAKTMARWFEQQTDKE
ncbi:flagellar biosynthesis protein FlhF [Magnetococcales bacterium HHB-1]